MKSKSILLLALIFILTQRAPAQFAPTLTEGNTWIGRMYGWGVNEYNYLIQGDTMVMNTFYKKLHIQYNGNNNNTYIALVREWTPEGKVYHYANDGQEHVLFDYSLEAGESTTILALGLEYEITIDSVTTVIVDGNERRKLHFSDNGIPAFWIEGVGSNYGVLDAAIGPTTDYWPILFCFYEDNDLTWTSYPDSYQCEDVLSVGSDDVYGPSLAVWPVPFQENLNYETTAMTGRGTLTITSSTGQIVYQESISHMGSTKSLYLPHLESGVYLLTIRQDDGKQISKTIVKL
jgi:hypothetical protein